MYYSNVPRIRKELILVKPIRKSNYLKNLEMQRYKGLKLIEEEKANILIDKILRKGNIYRDYSVFSKNRNENTFKTINNINKDNYIINCNNYVFKNKDSKKKKINYSTDVQINNKLLNKMSKENLIRRNLDRENFLYIIGDDIINSKYLPNETHKRKKKFE